MPIDHAAYDIMSLLRSTFRLKTTSRWVDSKPVKINNLKSNTLTRGAAAANDSKHDRNTTTKHLVLTSEVASNLN